MGDIFISYASVDRERAAALAAELERRGWSVWWDRAIPPGREFDEVIEEALDAARCVVVLWSRASIVSSWVKTEAAEAMRRKMLVPARIEDVKIPLEFRRLQAADLSRQAAGSGDEQMEFLAQSVARLVGAPPSAGEARPGTHPPPAAPQARRRRYVYIIACVVAAAAIAGTGVHQLWQDRIVREAQARVEAEQAVTARQALELAEHERAARERQQKEQADRKKALREQAPLAEKPAAPSAMSGVVGEASKEKVNAESELPAVAPTTVPGPLIIAIGAGNALSAFNPDTNKVVWRQAGNYRCVSSFDSKQALVLDDKGVFVFGKDGKIVRSLTSVDVRWVTRVARLDDDVVILSSADKKWIKAVDWSGNERWVSEGFHSPGAAVRFKGGVLLADGTAAIKVIDQTGKRVRELPVSRWAMSLALTPDGGLAVGVFGGVDKLGPGGATAWTRDGLGRVSSVQALADGQLLIADPDNRRLLKLNERGETIWEQVMGKGGDCAVELQ